MRGRINSPASFVSSPKFKAQTLITSLLLRDHLLMEIMTADEIAGTFRAVKDALDIRAHTVAHPRRNRIHIQYNFGPLWLCLSFYNLAFFSLILCLGLSIKPFSQQAYSMQTAGTTTISGERDQGVIISFLPCEQSLPSPTTCSLRGGFSLGFHSRVHNEPNTIRSKRNVWRKKPECSLFCVMTVITPWFGGCTPNRDGNVVFFVCFFTYRHNIENKNTLAQSSRERRGWKKNFDRIIVN